MKIVFVSPAQFANLYRKSMPADRGILTMPCQHLMHYSTATLYLVEAENSLHNFTTLGEDVTFADIQIAIRDRLSST